LPLSEEKIERLKHVFIEVSTIFGDETTA